MQQEHHRRSVRLPAFDYSSPGAYFITIVSHNRSCIFGDIVDGSVRRSRLGEIVKSEWLRTAVVRASVELGEFVVMPNHFHGIIWLTGDRSAEHYETGAFQKPVAGSISTIIGLFKSEVTKAARRELGSANVWQRGFYDHVFGNERALAAIQQYIVDNPARWAEDEENPANRGA